MRIARKRKAKEIVSLSYRLRINGEKNDKFINIIICKYHNDFSFDLNNHKNGKVATDLF